jgi:phage terminase large subunit-like protein
VNSANAVLSVAPAIEALARLKEEHPLAFATLWHNDPPRTSQRAPLQRAGVDAVAAFGGNGSGKTELGAMVACAVAYGRKHPACEAFIRRNKLEPSLFPPRPGIVLASSLNSTMSINIQRAAVERWAPAGTEWRNQHGPGFSEARFPNGGKIRFLTNDAGARAMQGFSADVLWLDEEHDEAIYNEGMQRLTRSLWEDRSGWAILTMTPLKGFSWVHRRFVGSPDEGSAAFFLHGADNPHIDQDKRERLLRGVNAGERAARDRGEFTQLEGRIFTEWSRSAHVVPVRDVDAEYLVAGCDFGTRHPFCYLLCAVTKDDCLEVIAEHYLEQATVAQHARAIHKLLAGREVLWMVADPEDRGARLSLAREHGIPSIAAKKAPGSIRSGINAISERLAINPISGQPALVVHECCTNLIREMEGYCWAPSKGAEVKDAPAPRQSDHAIDCLRYICSKLARSTFAIG